MLSACLRSLAVQHRPCNIDLQLVVVDNECAPRARLIVETFARTFPYALHYVHEPRAGIPMARNRALDEALALDAEWIAFIDDDETAAPDWIEQLLKAADEYQADVIHGLVTPVYPSTMPFWAIEQPKRAIEGEIKPAAATNNVLFHASLVRADGLGLRFDEAMRFTGGEDTDFFLRAHMKGAKIVQSRKPVVREELIPERLTFKKQVMRHYRYGAHGAYIRSKYQRLELLIGIYTVKVLFYTTYGIMIIFFSLLIAIYSRFLFKKYLLRGARRITKAWGTMAGLLSLHPSPYKNIDGY